MADYVSPHWAHAALVVIDLQNDFLDDGVAATWGTSAVLVGDAVSGVTEERALTWPESACRS